MSKYIPTFAYYRVSTSGQTTENQALEVERAGYTPDYVYQETISGSVAALERPEFSKMIDVMEHTKTKKRLIVTKIDRLGRDAADILSTLKYLGKMDCSVQIMQFKDFDMTSIAGKMMTALLSALSEAELEMLRDRTRAGQARAIQAGKKIGRPKVVNTEKLKQIRDRLAMGENLSAISRDMGLSRTTVFRVRESLKEELVT